MRKNGVDDSDLRQSVREMQSGLIDAYLGGHLLKKRMALQGQGKRASARTIVATRFSGDWFYLVGFNKNEQPNLNKSELKGLQQVASYYLELSHKQLQQFLTDSELIEVIYAAN